MYNQPMSTKDDLNSALIEALRAGEETRKTTLRGALAAIKLLEVDNQEELDEKGLIAVLHKEVKSRRELIADAKKADRPDLITAAEEEIVILEDFLPQAMSEDELKSLVGNAISETGAESPADMGKVMQAVMSKTEGRADGSQVSQIVRQALQND